MVKVISLFSPEDDSKQLESGGRIFPVFSHMASISGIYQPFLPIIVYIKDDNEGRTK